MELRHLRYFVAVGEEQHYGRGAQRLRVAQPALSRQIQDLEEEVGFKLFDRLSRGVKLSTAGKLFLEEARIYLKLAVPKAHPLTKPKKLRLRDLSDASFIWFPRRESPLFYDRLMHACFRGGLKSPHIVQEGVNEATILSLVSCGLGVAFVSSATRWRCPESVALLPVTDMKLPLPFALIWRKDNASPLLEKFVADVRLLSEVEAYSKH